MFLVILALSATQIAQASEQLLREGAPTNAVIPTLNEVKAKNPRKPFGTAIGNMPVSPATSVSTEAQQQPQSPSAPRRPHRHTLRNILIISVAVGAMTFILSAAVKK